MVLLASRMATPFAADAPAHDSFVVSFLGMSEAPTARRGKAFDRTSGRSAGMLTVRL